MPLSTADGRGWVYDRIAQTTAPVILDIGAGEGTYSNLARHLRLDAEWIAVEIHEPYVERFLLESKYDVIVVADARRFRPHQEPYVVLMGDVLEHMPREDAVELIEWHLQHADEIMVSVPIVYSPQEACHGNDHEEHLYHWQFHEMASLLPGCETFEGALVGRYWWRRHP